ncbi:MAG: ribonuclease J [Aeriscardovia sp.]|nr:ribonuclease J [Aeriscardovia sp.]
MGIIHVTAMMTVYRKEKLMTQKKNAHGAQTHRRATGKYNSKGRGTDRRVAARSRAHQRQIPVKQDDKDLVAPPKYRKGSIRVVALGGLGEIGRNMNVIEYNGHILLIDCGVLFPDGEQPGVDVILPDFSYIKHRLNKVEALVLTHGHEDHIGAVPYLLRLRPDIPLIGSKLTLAFVAAKCEEFNIVPKTIVVNDPDTLKVGPFTLDFISVTHSIPDALAVCVKTPAGHIIDTGDMKIDPLPLDHRLTDLRAFAREGEEGVDLLMMDSTNAEVKGFVKPEISVTPALDHAFANATSKIIVASFSSHVHRVQQIVDVAHQYGRKVVFVGRSMIRNMGIASDLNYLKLPEDTIIDLKAAKDYPDNKLVYMCTGSQGEPLAALGRIANGIHPDIQIEEFDTVILASSLIPGNESEVYKVINKLVALGAKVINRDNAAIHVSGHADEGELLYMYNIIKPKNAMPIHGESRHQLANGLIAVKTGVDPKNVILARDGDVVDLYKGKAAIVGSVPCHYVYVDGDSVGELTDDELEKRRILGTEGFVSSFVVVDTRKKAVIKGPRIFLNAVAEDEEEFRQIRSKIIQVLEDAMMRGEHDTIKLQQLMRHTLGAWISRTLHRKPMIVPVVTDLATASKE